MSDLQHDPEDDFVPDDDGVIYEEPRRRLSPLARMLVILAIGIAVVAFGGLVWFAYNEGVHSGAEEAAPVLRAEDEPVKHKPEDAGGMAIPHQDKLVYNRIAPGQAQQPVERLLPPPEDPVERPAPPAAEPAAVPTDPAAGNPAAGKPAEDSIAAAIVEAGEDVKKDASEAIADAKAPFVRETPVAKDVPVPPPAPPLEAPQAAEKPAEPQVAAAPVPPPAAVSGPAWRIQLASLTSDDAARADWQRIQKANTDLLGALSLNLQTASLAKGTFYRIQAGPLADRAAASALCDKLKARKQDCLVVAP